MRVLPVLFLLPLLAQSQPQVPREQSIDRQKETPTQQKQIEKPNQQSQAPVTINQFYTDPDNREPRDGSKEQKQGAFFEALKTGSDFLLAAFTLLLAIATAILAGVAYLQWQTMKRHEKEFRRMAEHMQAALETTQKATDLTRQSLILAQRPRITVRFVRLDNEDVVLRWRSTPGGGGKDSVEISGKLRVVNVGGSAAHILSLACAPFLLNSLPTMTPLPFDPTAGVLPDPVTLPAGKYGTLQFPKAVRQDPVPFEDLDKIAKSLLGVYVIGEIVYRDDLDIVRTTYFCRKWDGIAGRFVQVDNPDYKSAD